MELQDFGETSLKCETAVRLYCDDKHNKTLDPGCFVDSFQSYGSEEHPLQSFCEEEDCFGVELNFGSSNSRLHCPELNNNETSNTATELRAISPPRPFQNQTQLDELGANQLFNEGSFLKASLWFCYYYSVLINHVATLFDRQID